MSFGNPFMAIARIMTAQALAGQRSAQEAFAAGQAAQASGGNADTYNGLMLNEAVKNGKMTAAEAQQTWQTGSQTGWSDEDALKSNDELIKAQREYEAKKAELEKQRKANEEQLNAEQQKAARESQNATTNYASNSNAFGYTGSERNGRAGGNTGMLTGGIIRRVVARAAQLGSAGKLGADDNLGLFS